MYYIGMYLRKALLLSLALIIFCCIRNYQFGNLLKQAFLQMHYFDMDVLLCYTEV